MSNDLRPVVLSVAALRGIEAIDGGDTIVVHFVGPDGRDVALLVPRNAIADLNTQLSSLS